VKKTVWLVLLGILAFALMALATLPADVAIKPLAARGVIVSGVTGTIWKGSAQVVQSGQINVGAVQWKLHAVPLLTGKAVADIKVARADGSVEATVTAAPSGRILFENLLASLPLDSLPPSLSFGWKGTLHTRLAVLEIDNNWPARAIGTVEVVDLIGPPRQPASMGGFKLAFPDQSPPGVVAGALTDISGPLQIAGTLELKAANRSYLINGLVSPRADAPPQLLNALQFLGPPDAQGRRPVALDGTL
jgi:general secretion pathway protein N